MHSASNWSVCTAPTAHAHHLRASQFESSSLMLLIASRTRSHLAWQQEHQPWVKLFSAQPRLESRRLGRRGHTGEYTLVICPDTQAMQTPPVLGHVSSHGAWERCLWYVYDVCMQVDSMDVDIHVGATCMSERPQRACVPKVCAVPSHTSNFPYLPNSIICMYGVGTHYSWHQNTHAHR